MKKKRFSVEQSVAVLKQIELGLSVADASRQIGVSEQAIYRWKKVSVPASTGWSPARQCGKRTDQAAATVAA